MSKDELVKQAEALLEQLEILIENNMPYKGNVSEECQKTTIMLALNEVGYTLNGLEEEDLIENED
jgi:hypothetical protein